MLNPLAASSTARHEPQSSTSKRFRFSWFYWVGSTLSYSILTLYLYGSRVFDKTLILEHASGDVAQEVWTLSWPAYALTHGQNLFLSTWANYPHGINMMVAPTPPLLGVVYAPITWIFGPVAAFMLAMRVGFVLSALSAQWVARRLGISRTGAVVAGLLYGFSAEQLFQGQGHVYFIYVAVPPLIFYVLYLLLQRKVSALRGGVAVGALTSVDFLISPERALMTAAVACIGLAVLGAMRPRSVTRSACRNLLLAGGAAAVTGMVILFYPLKVFFGMGHFTQAHKDVQMYRADLAEYALPGPLTHFSFLGIHVTGILGFYLENGAYVGVPLLIGLVVLVVLKWNVFLVRFGAVMTGIGAVLSLGSRLVVYGDVTPVPLPEGLLGKLSLLGNVVPSRYELYVWLGVSLLAAYGLDCALRWWRSRWDPRVVVRSMGMVVAIVCVGVITLTLLPAGRYPIASTSVPSWLGSSEAHAVMPVNSVTLFYPYATGYMGAADHPMLDEAVDGFRYRIIGAYVCLGNRYGADPGVAPLDPIQLPTVFIREFAGVAKGWVPTTTAWLPPLPQNDAATADAFRRFVRRYHVATVVVEGAQSRGAEAVVKYLVRAFGAPNSRDGGAVDFWRSSQLQ